MISEALRDHLSDDLQEVDKIIANCLKTESPLINNIGSRIVATGGKRVRPILNILSSKIFGRVDMRHITTAAAIELIHAATLLHDDVIDDSKTRRSKPTINATWGNKLSILAGDFLFSKAFKLMSTSGLFDASSILSCASETIAIGEMTQLGSINKVITLDEYNIIIQAKTAELFAAACQIGAIMSNQPPKITKLMYKLGAIIGSIFQITDDAQDYFSSTEQLGKAIGNDFIEGKVTLPIIFAYAQEKEYITQVFKAESRNNKQFDCIVQILEKHNIKQQISSYVQKLSAEAHNIIKKLKIDNAYSAYLAEVVQSTQNRI